MAATMSVAEAKAKLSELLDRVEQGEEVTITRHGKPVARVCPASPGPINRVAGDWGWAPGSVDPAVFAPMTEEEFLKTGC